ncbi:unnamed protein product [Closterium sp. Naga37s-1]|nr:unnamed protein product [Closterium sp. Naga37s-1]
MAESPRFDHLRSPAAVLRGSVDPSSIRGFDTSRLASSARLHSANPDAAALPTPRIRSAFVPSASPTPPCPLAHAHAHANVHPHSKSHSYSRTRWRVDLHLGSGERIRPVGGKSDRAQLAGLTKGFSNPNSPFSDLLSADSPSADSPLAIAANPPRASAASAALGSGGLGFGIRHGSWSSSSSSSGLSGASRGGGGGGGFLGFSSPSKKFHEKRLIGYTPEQVFDVVAGVERYADFLPWCVGSHVLWRAPEGMEAELEIGFHMLREKYLSRVTYKRPLYVTARSADTGLFHHLDNHWEFAPGRLPGSCLLSFSVDFQFRSLLYTQRTPLPLPALLLRRLPVPLAALHPGLVAVCGYYRTGHRGRCCSCLLSFAVDFQFRSLLYTQVGSTPRWALHPGAL